jgi:peptide/nickel transport system permease protein
VMEQEYVRTARSKGLSRGRVMLKHAMANAILPLVTLAGLDLAGLLSGVVLTETVFDWPGIGRLAFDAIFNLDIPLIMGTVLFAAFLIVVANLVIDLLYAWLDPRIQLSGHR